MTPCEQVFDWSCADQVRIAERELSAFVRAVTQRDGFEQAKLAAEDWLEESALLDSRPLWTSRNWRAVTIAASARLANRVIVQQHLGLDIPCMRSPSRRQSAVRRTG